MGTSTLLAKVADPQVALRFAGLAEQEAAALALMKENSTDIEFVKVCFTELRGIRGERAALTMISTRYLDDYKSGPPLIAALDAYYCATACDPLLWADVLGLMHALVAEATGMAVEHVSQAKHETAQAAEKTRKAAAESATAEEATRKAAAESARAEEEARKAAEDTRKAAEDAKKAMEDAALAAEKAKQERAKTAAKLVAMEESRKRDEARTRHEADMARDELARAAANAEAKKELDAAESRARALKMQNEAAEANVRRKEIIFNNRNIFWRALHTLKDVA
jgi:flagellar biosynthesis GTPase FlhF